MRKNSIKNTRTEQHPTRRHQGPESGADDFRGSGGSST